MSTEQTPPENGWPGAAVELLAELQYDASLPPRRSSEWRKLPSKDKEGWRAIARELLDALSDHLVPASKLEEATGEVIWLRARVDAEKERADEAEAKLEEVRAEVAFCRKEAEEGEAVRVDEEYEIGERHQAEGQRDTANRIANRLTAILDSNPPQLQQEDCERQGAWGRTAGGVTFHSPGLDAMSEESRRALEVIVDHVASLPPEELKKYTEARRSVVEARREGIGSAQPQHQEPRCGGSGWSEIYDPDADDPPFKESCPGCPDCQSQQEGLVAEARTALAAFDDHGDYEAPVAALRKLVGDQPQQVEQDDWPVATIKIAPGYSPLLRLHGDFDHLRGARRYVPEPPHPSNSQEEGT